MRQLEHFSERLDGAALNEALVAARLAREGFYVVQSPIQERADFDLMTPDLTVYKLDPILMTKHAYVEVKSIKYEPEDTIIVCSEASFYRKYGPYRKTLPVSYVFVTPEKKLLVLLPGSNVKRGHSIYDSTRRSRHRVVLGNARELSDIAGLSKWLAAAL